MKKFKVTFFNEAGAEIFSATVETLFGFRHAHSLAHAEFKQAARAQADEPKRLRYMDVVSVDLKRVPHA